MKGKGIVVSDPEGLQKALNRKICFALQKNITTLILQNVRLTERVSHLMNGIEESSITTLILSSNELTTNDMSIITPKLNKLPLIQLTYNDNSLRNKGCSILANYLKENTNLTHLSLESNEIEPVGVVSIISSITLNTSFKYLNLHKNHMGVKGTQSISAFLSTNTILKSLDLSMNEINLKGIVALGKALSINTTLTYLNISGNALSDTYFHQFFKFLNNNTTLQHLHMKNNMLSGFPFVSKSLVTLNVEDNNISHRLANHFLGRLIDSKNTSLKAILLKSPPPSQPITESYFNDFEGKLTTYLKMNTILSQLSLPFDSKRSKHIQTLLFSQNVETATHFAGTWPSTHLSLEVSLQENIHCLLITTKDLPKDIQSLIISFMILIHFLNPPSVGIPPNTKISLL
eukprot:TRINITY_DN3812_c0_g1_i2.p1 TRINITY_DN3812_c0_g1~~TRINITY_DN3812_c0_g1_i2.p1  ORF type:complete len:403 (-),score=88.26 TRINITY_DN3812_c0_g1_i2:390-1598(-)